MKSCSAASGNRESISWSNSPLQACLSSIDDRDTQLLKDRRNQSRGQHLLRLLKLQPCLHPPGLPRGKPLSPGSQLNYVQRKDDSCGFQKMPSEKGNPLFE